MGWRGRMVRYLGAGVVVALAVLVLLLGYCRAQPQSPAASWSRSYDLAPGQHFRFENGYEVVVQAGWQGNIDLSPPPAGDSSRPEEIPLELWGPGDRRTLVCIETTAGARTMMRVWPDAKKSKARFGGVEADIQVTPDGDGHLVDLWLWAPRGVLEIEVSDNADVERAIRSNASPQELLDLISKEVGLGRTVE